MSSHGGYGLLFPKSLSIGIYVHLDIDIDTQPQSIIHHASTINILGISWLLTWGNSNMSKKMSGSKYKLAQERMMGVDVLPSDVDE